MEVCGRKKAKWVGFWSILNFDLTQTLDVVLEHLAYIFNLIFFLKIKILLGKRYLFEGMTILS